MDSPARTKADSGAVITEEQAQEWAAKAAGAGQPRLRILTGDRTTGRLHLGHYVGSLKHRVKYQRLYDTYVLMADVQALTTHYDRPEVLKESVREVLLDYLAAGLEPYLGGEDDGSKVKIVVQSLVPSIAELTVFYGLLVPTGLLKHNPTLKAEAEQHGFVKLTEPEDHAKGWHFAIADERADSLRGQMLSEFPELGKLDQAEVARAIASLESDWGVSEIQEYGKYVDDTNPYAPYRQSVLLRRSLRETVRNARRSAGLEQLPYGFLGYPVSQAADITFVGAHLVPVGPDQVPLIELCREVVHRFNSQYGGATNLIHPSSGGSLAAVRTGDRTVAPTGMEGGQGRPHSQILTTPYALLGVREALQGLDGNAKMSKSLSNAIYLSETDEEIWAKVKVAPTDPQRMRRNDPGRPEVCNIFSYHKVFNAQKEAGIDEAALGVPSVTETAELCRTAGIGCVDCKKNLCAKLKAILDPMRERRAQWAARPGDLLDVLKAGTQRANEEGEKTLARVKAAMHMDYFTH